MRKFGSLIKAFRDDEGGATMIEYTVLVGLITVALLVIIGAVAIQLRGDWVDIRNALIAT